MFFLFVIYFFFFFFFFSTEASFAIRRKGRFVLRGIVAFANIVIYIFIFVVLIIILVDPSKQSEGVVVYEFSIVFVILYSLASALIFLLVSTIVIIRVFCFTAVNKTKRLYVNAILVCIFPKKKRRLLLIILKLKLISVCIVCTLCFALRGSIFLYRPITDEYLPLLIFYQYGYWIPEIPVVLFLILIMNEPKRRKVKGGYRKQTDTDIIQVPERWVDKTRERASTIIPMEVIPEPDNENISNQEKQYLLVSSGLELKGQAQPRIAFFMEDPRSGNIPENQTTEIIFNTVSSVNFHTIFEIDLDSISNNILWFGVFSSTYQADESNEDALSQIKVEEGGKDNLKELISKVDFESNETCIGYSSLSVDDIRKEMNNQKKPIFNLDLIGSDRYNHGVLTLCIEKSINIPTEKLENMFIKNYIFDSKNGERIYLQDEMGESPMAFTVAAKLLKIAYKRKQEELRQFESSFESLNIVGVTKGFVKKILIVQQAEEITFFFIFFFNV